MGKFNSIETSRDKIWSECVKEGKILAKMNAESRLKIVELAEKCCTIHYGGRSFETRYTLVNFANEIGINAKTLNEWVRLKRNVLDNLEPEQQAIVKQTDLQLIDREMKGMKRSSPEYKSAVKEVTRVIMSSTGSTRKMMKYVKHMNTILFNVKHKPMINDCDRKVLVEILHISRSIAQHLEWVDYEPKRPTKSILRRNSKTA